MNVVVTILTLNFTAGICTVCVPPAHLTALCWASHYSKGNRIQTHEVSQYYLLTYLHERWRHLTCECSYSEKTELFSIYCANPPLTPLAKQLFFQVIILHFTHVCCCIISGSSKYYIFLIFDFFLTSSCIWEINKSD